jgi:hypothetical protein
VADGVTAGPSDDDSRGDPGIELAVPVFMATPDSPAVPSVVPAAGASVVAAVAGAAAVVNASAISMDRSGAPSSVRVA